MAKEVPAFNGLSLAIQGRAFPSSMPLKTCQLCGAEMSAEAVACPKCAHPNRAKTKSGSTGRTLGVLAVLLVVLGVIVGWYLKDREGTRDRTEDVRPNAKSKDHQWKAQAQSPSLVKPQLLDDRIEEVFAQFRANNVVAKEKYVNKRLKVVGVVSTILDPSVFLVCRSADGTRTFEVECLFSRSETRRVQTGESITAIGTVRDGNSLMVYLKDCVREN